MFFCLMKSKLSDKKIKMFSGKKLNILIVGILAIISLQSV